MKITKQRLEEIIKEELQKEQNTLLEVDGVAPEEAKKAVENVESFPEQVQQALRQGAEEAKSFFTAKNLLAALEKTAAHAGYSDPCDLVKKDPKRVQDELAKMEEMTAVLTSSDDALENLNRFNKILIGGAVPTGLATAVSWSKYSIAMAAGMPIAAASQFVSTVTFGLAGGGTTAAGVKTAAIAGSTVLGLALPTWQMIGFLIMLMGIITYIYKWLLRSGYAGKMCTMKNLAVELTLLPLKGAAWAYESVIAPVLKLIFDWAKSLVLKIKNWSQKKESWSRTSSMPLLETSHGQTAYNEAIDAIRQLNSLNKAALSIYFDSGLIQGK